MRVPHKMEKKSVPLAEGAANSDKEAHMSKIIVAVLMAVLLSGAALYVLGAQIVPAAGSAGNQTKAQIHDAFQ
ncbi:hypothetical protein JCM16163A_06960 [Paenibacillus sp. YK5]|uniref:Uncharacterized protein n=1 Tax=Paenibacillus naphthalenovorans TaxID=162209 RepID=A0A0U2VZ94_9BACL|nr:hypothetical protein IJ22_12280 [Paenibacillus naphthalenovorans]GCL71331.1 hypothetical protein PN4B1_12360 [Paenibacillus naphthalenovorans]SDI73357.1 hypothetical protein SAMN05421868_1103 [Paenibacillus naphthalenovorans]